MMKVMCAHVESALGLGDHQQGWPYGEGGVGGSGCVITLHPRLKKVVQQIFIECLCVADTRDTELNRTKLPTSGRFCSSTGGRAADKLAGELVHRPQTRMRTGIDSGPPCTEARPDPTATVAGGCREQAGRALLGKRRRREARPGEQGRRASLCRGQRRRVSGVPGCAGAGGQVSAPGKAPPAGVTRGRLQGPGGRGQPAAGEEQGIGVGGRNSLQKFVMKARTGIVQNHLHVSVPHGLEEGKG